MTSKAQILANRANAQKSTGPRTPADKAVASQNAVTHGFLARETVIQGEDAGAFAVHREGMLRDLGPAGDAELDMAERIVGLSWRLRRAERLQTEAFEALYEKMATGAPGGGTSPEGVPGSAAGTAGGAGSGADRLLGRMLVEDFSNGRVLERLLLYERRIENSLYRTLRELRGQKRMRLAGAPVEPVGRVSAGVCRATGVPSALLSGQALPLSWDHGRDAHATVPPDSATANLFPAQTLLCKTKPISEEVSSLKCEVASEESQTLGLSGLPTSDFPPKTAAQPHLCETNPISRGDPSSLPAVRRVA